MPDAPPVLPEQVETPSPVPVRPPVAEPRTLESGRPLEPHRVQLLRSPFAPYRGMVRRFFVVYRHVLGLLAGGLIAYVRALPPARRRGLRSPWSRLGALLVTPFVSRELRALPFPVQLRRRLEILGPTYIKLGQILAIREDLLPSSVTDELQNLFDRLPAVPFGEVQAIIERSLGRTVGEIFDYVEDPPIGSASIAQAHRARLVTGEDVVVKVIKPGITEVIQADLQLLKAVGTLLEAVIPRYQPRQIIGEFSAYTIREVDYTYEADNAETFAANFADMPDVVFPKIHRQASSVDVLTMELLRGFKPTSAQALALPPAERERLVDLGAASIVRMLYQDGFFHADLHAGNLMIIPDPDGGVAKLGFIDLGMVGRFEERTRRAMLHYFHALVTGDIEGATKFLSDLSRTGPDSDVQGFRRAVADLSRRFVSLSQRGDFSIGQLILESVGLGGRYRVFFPVEMTLMVKALVTFEGVGRMLQPNLDVAAAARTHVTRVFQRTFNPQIIARELLRSAPEMLDLLTRLPSLLGAGFRAADEHFNGPPRPNPLKGIRGSIVAGACIVAGAVVVVQGGHIAFAIALFVLAFVMFVAG